MKKRKLPKLGALFIIAAMLMQMLPMAAWADGPVEINSAEDLYNVRDDLSGSYILMSDIDLSDYGAGYDGGAGWEPIGTQAFHFTGTFDCNGHTITGLYINRPALDNQGLFGVVGQGAVIEDVELVNVNVTGHNNIGGLVGQNNGSIINSFAAGSVTGVANVGGLAGSNNGNGTITGSSAAVGITGSDYCVGGLVGRNGGSISSSSASGNVTGDGCVGGLAGKNNSGSNITESRATGTVNSNNDNAGGLIGFNFGGAIQRCYATGNVTGNSFDSFGGLVGGSSGGGAITDSYATGAVTGPDCVGGLVGYNSNSSITSCYAVGAVTGTSNVGGLVGDNNGGNIISSYFDCQTTGQNSSDGGSPLNTGEMMESLSYPGWDFGTVWAIKDLESYPFFRWPIVPQLAATVAPGTAAGTTTATITGAATSRFVVNITDNSVATPHAGDNAPTNGANLVASYTSGADITTGVAEGKYLQVYDVASNGFVEKFYQKQLAAGDINTGDGTVTYTVTYNGNGSTGGAVPTDSNTYAQGDTVTVLGNTGSLTKTGHTFAGWNTAANGSGTSYADGATFIMGDASMTLYAKWTATGGNGSSSDHSSTPATTPSPTNNGTDISVNGQNQGNAATSMTQVGTNGQTTTTVTLDEKKVGEILDKLPDAGTNTGTAQNSPVITISVVGKADTVVGELNGQMVKDMENKDVILEVKTETASYTIPAQQIDISAVSQSIGQDVKLSDVKVQIKIAKPDDAAVKVVEDSANEGGFTLVVPPVEFNITCTFGDKTVEVSQFNSYVERTVAIPDGVDPEKITTAVVIDPDGTVRHVPTKVIVIDGKYYAQINSLTNSTYSVIWHPIEFKDVANHWAKEAINDMGSRMVISGVGNDMFDPERDITRAEFAAIVVRALGLKPRVGKIPFTDVKGTDWYSNYVITAAEYKIISGYGDGKFGPDDKITREQTMTMVARAMNIIGLKAEFVNGEMDKLLAGFGDAVKSADYARNSIAACVKTGILSGRNGNLIAPKDNITRAEVAVIAKRLLQKSNLI